MLSARAATCSGAGGVVGTGEKPSRAKMAATVGCASILPKFRASTVARAAAATTKVFIAPLSLSLNSRAALFSELVSSQRTDDYLFSECREVYSASQAGSNSRSELG